MTKFFRDEVGNYLGGFDGATPPDGAIEVPGPPDNARQVWDINAGVWLAAAPAVPAVPAAVTPLQARKALLAAGLLDDVAAYVALQDQETHLAWDYASEVRRDNVLIIAAAGVLGWTDAQLDQLFVSASSL